MGYITEAQANDPNYIDPYSGAPIGIGSTSWKNGSYVQVPSGKYVYVGPQATPVETNPGWVGPTHNSLENQAFMAQDKLYNDYRNQQYQLLRDSNIDQANYIDSQMRMRDANPSYAVGNYVDTDAYRKNRQAAIDSTAKYNNDKEATTNSYQKQIDDRINQQNALQNAQYEATQRILHNDDANTQKDILTNRSNSGNTSTDIPALTLEYLKSIGLVSPYTDSKGKPVLNGVGNTNFDPSSGKFAISQAQRDQLKQDRADLQSGKYNDKIALGDFSPSGTGLEGYDGKPINTPPFAFMNPNDSSGGVSPNLKQQANYLAMTIANGGVPPGLQSYGSQQGSSSGTGSSSSSSMDALRQLFGNLLSSMPQGQNNAQPQTNASTGPTTDQQGGTKAVAPINASTGPSTSSALSSTNQQQTGPTLASASTKSRSNYKSSSPVPMTTPVSRNTIRLV